MSTGLFTTTNLTTDLAKKSFAGMITRLMPNGAAPLFGITSMLESETAVQVEHGFFTKTMLFPSATVSGTNGSTLTTLTVTSTASLLPHMVLQNSTTFENILVTGIISGTQFNCIRGFGASVAAASMSDAQVLNQVGTAFEESSVRPSALVINPVRITNITQIFRNTWGISDTIRQTMMIAGDTNVAESKQDCAAFHAVDIEKALIFGQKSNTGATLNGQPIRAMAGLVELVTDTTYYPTIANGTSNVTTAGSTTTYAQLETALDGVFNQVTDPKGSPERVLFVGGTARKVLNGIGKLYGTYFIRDQQTSWGLSFDTIKLTRGTFRIVEHPLLNSNSVWSKMAIAVDLPTFRLAYLGDRKTQYRGFNEDGDTDASDNGIDAVGGTLTTEVTCVVKNPSANAVIRNLTAAA
jgi:hypothetical protein